MCFTACTHSTLAVPLPPHPPCEQVGEALAQFAVEKQHAVEAENYETAEECKERADRLRVYMYQQLNVFGLVEDSSVLGRHAVRGRGTG